MSIESGAVLLIDSAGNEIAVADGVATPASTTGYHAMGSDGTNSRYLKVDTSGRQVITGAETPGTAVSGKPVLFGGTDGTNVRVIKTATDGVVLTNVESWIGSTAPTVGQKTMANSLPVAIASDQGALTVSGTVTANIGTSGSLALDATLTGGTQKAIVRGGAKGATAAADVTSTSVDANTQALHTNVTNFPATQAVSGTITANQGTAAAATAPWAARLSDGTSFYNTPTGSQLPAALVGGRLDTNNGAWLGSTAPTVGSKTSANSIPVVIASDQGAVAVSGTITAQQSTASSLKSQVQGEAAADAAVAGNPLLMGGRASDATPTAMSADGDAVSAWHDRRGAYKAALVDDAGDSVMDGTNNALRVNVVASSSSGGDGAIVDGVSSGIKATVLDYTNSNPLAVRLTDTNGDYVSGGGGTQYTEDVAAASDPVGTQFIARRRDSLSTETTTDGDNTAVNSTAKGELYVKHVDSVPVTDNGGSLTVDGTITANQGTAAAATAPWAARLSDGTSFYNTPTGAQLPSSLVGGRLDANVGAWLGSTAPTVGSKTSANSVPVVIASDQGAVAVSGTVTVAQATASSLNAEVQGDAAHDAVVSGNPVLVGGYASAAAPTDVSADGDVVRAWLLRNGATATVVTAGGALIGGDATNGLDVDVTRLPALAAGTNNIGDVDVLTVPAPLSTTGGGTEAAALRVTIANDSTGVVSIDDNGGSLTVDGTVTANAGTGTFGVGGPDAHDAAVTANPVVAGARASDAVPTAVSADGDVVRLWADRRGAQKIVMVDDAGDSAMDGTNNALRVNVVATSASGGDGAITDGVSSAIKATVLDYTNSNPLAVRLTDTNGDYVSGGGGTQYTEDVAAASDPIGTQLIARRRDSLSTETTTDGDNTAINSTAKGELYVKHVDSVPVTDNGGSLTVDGTVTANQGTAAAATAPWAARLSDGTSFYNTPTGAQLPSALVSGRLDVNTGAWLGSTAPTVGQKTMANSLPVTVASDQSTLPTKEVRSSTGTASSVSSSASSVTILASNSNRLGATVFNDSTQVLFLLLGSGTASSSNYSVRMVANAYYEVPFGYTGQLTGIWASANGNARVTELT